MTYSLDFRKRVLSMRKERKLSFKETGSLFNVSSRSLMRWDKNIFPCANRNKPSTKIDMELLKQNVKDKPDSYQYERAGLFKVSQSTIYYALKRLGVSYKKNSFSSKSKNRKA